MNALSDPASCLGTELGCFCESSIAFGMEQPSNGLSSLAFVAVALWILLRHKRSALSWAYAGALAVVGFGSAYYHGHLTFLGQTVDFAGMYLAILLAPFAYWGKTRGRLGLPVWSGYGSAVAVSLVVLTVVPDLRRILFGILVAVTVWLLGFDPRHVVSQEGRVWLWRGFALFAGGYVFWNFDSYKILCEPSSWLQMHAVWHLASAAASYCLYRSMAAEGRR